MKLNELMPNDEYIAMVTAKLEAKHVKSGECWLWIGATDREGYGKLKINGKTYGTHRLQVLLRDGSLSPYLLVQHSCDVRNCINPDHLKVGTDKTNVDDMITKGRAKFQRYPEAHRVASQTISTGTVLEAIRDFLNGLSIVESAGKHDLEEMTFRNYLKSAFGTSEKAVLLENIKDALAGSNPIPRYRPVSRISSADREVLKSKIAELCSSGLDCYEVAVMFDISPGTVRTYAIERGVDLKRKRKVTDDMRAAILSDPEDNYKVAAKHGISFGTVYTIRRQAA